MTKQHSNRAAGEHDDLPDTAASIGANGDEPGKGAQGSAAGGGEVNNIEEFFQRLPGSFHWPKPNAEAVAAAVEAIQRMSGGTAAAENMVADAEPVQAAGTCAVCRGSLPTGARFCVWCGAPNATQVQAAPAAAPAGAQHHFHHHYHHQDYYQPTQ